MGSLLAVATRLAGAFFALILLWGASCYAQTSYALLIGVTDQPALLPGTNLIGPSNDVKSLRDYLIDRSPLNFKTENVQSLCCGIEGDAAPTHAHILEALDDLAAKAIRGDFVFIHFSGYGARQPASLTGEPDGLEEILLPADVQMRSPSQPTVVNALRKVELRQALRAITAKGAFVWFTVDSSFSGSASTAAESREVERRIDPSRLGLTADELIAAEAPKRRGLVDRTPPLSLTSGPDDEGMVVFTAAQTGEPTTEFEQDHKVQGLFTAALISALTKEPQASYRRIAESIIQSYAGAARRRPTPSLEGMINASYDHLAATSASPPSTSTTPPSPAEPQSVDVTLRVALPDFTSIPDSVRAEIMSALGEMEKSEHGFFLKLVLPGDPADIRLSIDKTDDVLSAFKLWLLPPSGELVLEPGFEPPSVVAGDGLAERLSHMLVYVYRATAISRLAALPWTDLPLTLEFEIHDPVTSRVRPLRPGEIPVVHPGEEVHVRIENATQSRYDVNLFYLGADYSLTHIMAERVQEGDKSETGLFRFTDTSFGRERMIVFVSKAAPLSTVEDLFSFEQDEVSQTASDGHFAQLLNAIAQGKGNATPTIDSQALLDGTVIVRQLDVLP